MLFHNPLRQAVLIKRYKRFLADVKLENGDIITVHCPNTGAMTGCAESGMRVWLSDSENPKRKYRYTWELVEDFAGHLICVNTHRANQIAGEALEHNLLAPLQGVQNLRAEQKYGYDNRRIDWFGVDSQQRHTFIEVKSVTLATHNQGYFPDTVSKRALEHLRSLQDMVTDGHRALVLYTVLHSGIEQVSAADHIDPRYADACRTAREVGVEFYALGCKLTPTGISPLRELPVLM
jgi:sugar fermentation stimulation protein